MCPIDSPGGKPSLWAQHSPQRSSQTYLYLPGFVLLEHKAEDIGVGPSEQTQVERAVSNGEFLEEHWKQNGGVGAISQATRRTQDKDRTGSGLGGVGWKCTGWSR